MAIEETKAEEGQEPEEKKAPKAERTYTQTQLNEAMSSHRKEASESRKVAKEAQAAAHTARDALSKAQGDLEIAKMADPDDPDSTAKVRRLLDQRSELEERGRKLAEREEYATGLEARLVKQTLSTTYGIPVEDLEQYDNSKDMELAALRYQLDQLKNASPAEEQEEEEVTSGKFESGEGQSSVKKPPFFANPTPENIKKWQEYEDGQLAVQMKAQS